MKKLLTIEGMSCGHCTMHVQSALEEIPGVTKAAVDLLKKSAMVEGDGDAFNDVALKRAVSEAGYRVTAILGGR
jgi:copper chaperone CopZ